MNINKITRAMSAVILVGMTLPTLAEDRSGWYLGVAGGPSHATIAEAEIKADLLTSGYQTTEFRFDDRDVGYKIFTGYQMNTNFAIEGGYFDLGQFSYHATTLPAGSQHGRLTLDGWNLDLVGTLPLTERASLFARIGAHRSTANVDFIGTGAVNILTTEYRKRSTHYKFGVGYEYQFNRNLAMRIEAERYRMDDAVGNRGDIDLYSVSLLYRFGSASPYKAVTPVAMPVMAPAVAAVAVAPVQGTAVEYCSGLEIEFAIANNDIARVNNENLLVLATFMDAYPETTARIEGHTDNVGTETANQRLSLQRAQSVVDYLVTEHRIARKRLTAVGFGEMRPLADNVTDAGKQANRRIHAVINCATDIKGLQPLPARVTLAMELAFDTDSAMVKGQYHDELETVANYLRVNPELTATLEGHTDNTSPATAQQVSKARAQSVADYLVTKFGIERSRLSVEGFGSTRRDTYNINAAQRQENRRVSIIIGYPD